MSAKMPNGTMNRQMHASLTIVSRIRSGLAPYRSNLLIAAICIMPISLLDLTFSYALNEDYAFHLTALSKASFWITFLFVFIAIFAGRVIFWTFLSIIPVFSIFQIVNFEYFGSYILPIHFIQLLPDFFLIMSELVSVVGEILPIVVIGGLMLLLYFGALCWLSYSRAIQPRATFLIIAILAGDLVGNYAFINHNSSKLGEPSFNALFPTTNNLGIFNFYKSARFLVVGILPDRLTGAGNDYPALPEPVAETSPDVNIVLIINESVRAENLSILGYELKTTPGLEAIHGLYASTIYAAGTMTRTSFTAIMNRLKYPGLGKQFVSQSNCLFRLAKQNGFKTHFFYAQGRKAADTLLPYMCANYLDSVLVDTDAPIEHRDYDESLNYLLENIDFNEKHFLVIGLNGAHSPYANKSPDSFKQFPDEYDNAILYSDHVISQLIETLQQRSAKPTYILITSDHGELLKGEDDRRGHGWFKGKVVKVPFLFLSVNDPSPDEVRQAVERVRSHFDIATLTLGLLGYDVTVEDPENKEIYINGSDLFGLAGQMRLRFEGTMLKSVEPINSAEAMPKVAEFSLEN